ncbi:hypothetical protein [Pseudoalteromonas sp. HM-SA03]|uniref:hypothetical protein n=1 Tax=Pseudoalteromonas sp. HM-SA03 TaxID=2029678 RepID=UPI001595B229|nr:hypothetical protein [Pseudoalteromonas sp. HM-SA03]
MNNSPKNYTEQLYKHLMHKAKLHENEYNDHTEFMKMLSQKLQKVRDDIKSKGE